LALHLLPLHALPVGVGEGVRPLFERFRRGVRYAPSLQLLHLAQQRSADRSKAGALASGRAQHMCAVQNPSCDLKFADIEAECVAQMWGRAFAEGRSGSGGGEDWEKLWGQRHGGGPAVMDRLKGRAATREAVVEGAAHCCRAGHHLADGPATAHEMERKVQCDECFEEIPVDADRGSCRRCDYDRCSGCAAAAVQRADVGAPFRGMVQGALCMYFACHGRFDPNDPNESCLHLAGGSKLTLNDVLARLKVSTSVTVCGLASRPLCCWWLAIVT
jgi:hypothetical protein